VYYFQTQFGAIPTGKKERKKTYKVPEDLEAFLPKTAVRSRSSTAHARPLIHFVRKINHVDYFFFGNFNNIIIISTIFSMIIIIIVISNSIQIKISIYYIVKRIECLSREYVGFGDLNYLSQYFLCRLF